MFKIWAKTIENDKIKMSHIYKGEGKYDPSLFQKYMSEICEQMDIPTPVVLKSHVRNFNNFNIAKFASTDFVEWVHFDFLTIEYCRDDMGEKKHIYKEYLPVD